MQIRLGLAALLIALASLPASAQAATSLGAYWPLNEPTGTTATDASGNDNAGTINGAARISGRFAGALQFDGVDDKVSVARAESLEPAAVTVEAWVRAAAAPGPFRYVAGQGADGCEVASYALYTGASGGLAFYVSDGVDHHVALSPAAPTTIWDGAWHHVAGTYDGKAVRLYVDGAEIGSGTPTAIRIGYGLANPGGLLGAFGGAGACELNWGGDLDEPRVWRRALDDDEIRASAAMGHVRTKRLAAQIGSTQAIIFTSLFVDGYIDISIESATGDERISSVRIHEVKPLGTGAGCGGLLKCAITPTNDGLTARLKVTRDSVDGSVKLRVGLVSGRSFYVVVASEKTISASVSVQVDVHVGS